MARWCAVIAVVVSAGCRGIQAPRQIASWSNEGQLCVVPEALAPELAAGIPQEGSTSTGVPVEVELLPAEPLAAVVLFSTCETCARQILASCSVSYAGDQAIVEASAQYIVEDGPCDERCEIVSATCPIHPLARGITTFELGELSLEVDLPSTTSDYCVGEPTAPVVSPE